MKVSKVFLNFWHLKVVLLLKLTHFSKWNFTLKTPFTISLWLSEQLARFRSQRFPEKLSVITAICYSGKSNKDFCAAPNTCLPGMFFHRQQNNFPQRPADWEYTFFRSCLCLPRGLWLVCSLGILAINFTVTASKWPGKNHFSRVASDFKPVTNWFVGMYNCSLKQ